MVLDFTDLRHHRGRLAMVAGASDPLHDGHIEYFRQARALGTPLLCSIASDDYVASKHRLSVSNSSSGRRWKLDHAPAVGDPTHMVEFGTGRRAFAREV